TTPQEESAGVMRAVEGVLARAGAESSDVDAFAHGMTVGTNALLEERGARTALVATRGFADLLEIGRQDRPHLYRLCAPKPAPLVPPDLRFEAAERVGREGVGAARIARGGGRRRPPPQRGRATGGSSRGERRRLGRRLPPLPLPRPGPRPAD